MEYIVLASGSSGNSYCFTDGETTFLIDAGISLTQLKKRMDTYYLRPEDVDAIFLTHLHPDHVKGVGAFQRKYPDVTVYLSSVALSASGDIIKRMRLEDLVPFNFGDVLSVGGFEITPFRTMHDSPGSAGYQILHNGKKLFLMTDTGIITEDANSFADCADVYFIEANYDAEMLENGPYQKWLKKRISGPYGHLSNSDAVSFAKKYAKRGASCIFVHLSENNNTVELVEKLMHREIQSGIFLYAIERGDSFKGELDDQE